MKPYRTQLSQALAACDNETRLEVCAFIRENEANDDSFLSRVGFSDETTFHVNGTADRHNVRICGMKQPHETVGHQRDSPEVNVFRAVSQKKAYGPIYFVVSCVQW